MGETYPDLYAAIGVHSGLPWRRQRHAVRLRRDEAAAAPTPQRTPAASAIAPRIVPTIVFHGDCDTTVHPRNGDQVIARARGGLGADLAGDGHGPAGSGPRRASLSPNAACRRRQGRAVLEQWVIHGAGHAWSGGSRPAA